MKPINTAVKDITGQKFGRLTVISLAFVNRRAYWNVRCDCGTQKVVCGKLLRKGQTRSCGCLQRDKATATLKTIAPKPVASRDTCISRFWSHVDKTWQFGCWNWTAGFHKGGYGSMWWDGRIEQSHRISYEIAHGTIPAGMHVCHKCDNRKCVNPDHLFLGTHADNMADMIAKKRHLSRGPKPKLNPDAVREIRALRGVVPSAEIAARYGISTSSVYHVQNGKGWSWVENNEQLLEAK